MLKFDIINLARKVDLALVNADLAGESIEQNITLKSIFKNPKSNKHEVHTYYHKEEFETKKQAQEFLQQVSGYLNKLHTLTNEIYGKIIAEIQPKYFRLTNKELRAYNQLKIQIDEKISGITRYAGQSNDFYFHAAVYIAQKLYQITEIVKGKPSIKLSSINDFLRDFLENIEKGKNHALGLRAIGGNPKLIERQKITFEELDPLIKSFLDYLKIRNYSKATISNYQGALFNYLKYLERNNSKVLEANRRTIRTYIFSQSEKKKDPNSINKGLNAINTFYKYCMRNNLITKNPAGEIPLLKVKKALINTPLPPDHINRVLDSMPIQTPEIFRDRIVLEILFGAGLRCNELMTLKISNIKRQTIKVNGKGNKERIIPIAKNLYELIKKFIKVWGNKSDYLIETNTGSKVRAGFISKITYRYLGVNPHSLRHSYASSLLNNGAPLIAVSKLLGHQSILSTQIYTHVLTGKIKEDYSKAHPKI